MITSMFARSTAYTDIVDKTAASMSHSLRLSAGVGSAASDSRKMRSRPSPRGVVQALETGSTDAANHSGE
jgi:hypothetical protein